MKEQQRKARPLPARLQAATDRLAKAKAVHEEAAQQVKDLKEKLEAAELELVEAGAKLTETEQELGAVKMLAAEGTAASTVGQVAECLAMVLGSHNMEQGMVKGLVEQVLQTFWQLSQAAAAPQPGLVAAVAATLGPEMGEGSAAQVCRGLAC